MKKKIIALFLCALMLLSTAPIVSMAAELGDVDSSGKVDATDARLALRAAVGLDKLSKEQIKLADVDFSGSVDATDARLILRAAVGLDKLHVHSYTSAVTTKATCEGKGVMTFTCSCGDTYTEEIPATGHKSVTDKAVAATCTENGKTEGEHCSVCNKVLKAQEKVPALGHKSVSDKAVAATCTENGKTEGAHCSVCNTVIKAQETVKAPGHKAELDKSTVVAADCTKDGYSGDYKCSVCGAVTEKGKVIPAKGHTEVTDKAVAATCTAAGKTEGKHCSVCNVVIKAQETVPAKGHTEVTDKAVAATCTTDGKTEGVHCSVCNVVLKAQETVKAPGHKAELDKSTVVAADCTKDGYSGDYKCSVCGAVTEKGKAVPATGHTTVTDKGVPPTCTEDGMTEGAHCSVCNAVLKAQEPVNATGHNIAHDESTIVEAGCTKDGYSGDYKCSVCGEITAEGVVLPALGHKIVTDYAVAPTCTEDGKTEGEHCSVCNEVLKAQETVPATGHEPVTDKAVAPTCTEDGKTEGEHCFVCGEVLKAQETLPAFGHDMTVTQEAVPPTCTEEGKTQGGYCKTCDSEVIPEAVPALGHDFKSISLTSASKCSVPGCEGEIPGFNNIVNGLKSRAGVLNYFTGIFEDISHYDEPVVSGTLAGMMEGEDMAASTEIEYAPLTVDRLLTQTNFHSKGMSFVSDLAEGDVKSIKIERADTVDFVAALPESFKSGKSEYDISKIKAYEFPELYKITLVIPESTVDITKPVSGTFVQDKIYTKNYRNLLEDMRLDISSGFDSLSKEMAGLESVVKMSSSGSFTTALTVEYFVRTDTFTPVAAKYSHVIDVNFNIKLTGTGLIKIEYLTMNQSMDMTSNSYYFFNNSFGM